MHYVLDGIQQKKGKVRRVNGKKNSHTGKKKIGQF